MPDPITYSEYIAQNPDSSAAGGSGYNTSGALGNLLTSLVQTGGQYLVAKETVKGISAANTVKSQAQIDAENAAVNRVVVSSSMDTKQIVIYGAIAAAVIVAILVLRKD